MSTASSALSARAAPRNAILFSNPWHFEVRLQCAGRLLREKGNLIRRITSLSTLVASFDMSDKATRPPMLITVSEPNLQTPEVLRLPNHNKPVLPQVNYFRGALPKKP